MDERVTDHLLDWSDDGRVYTGRCDCGWTYTALTREELFVMHTHHRLTRRDA
jgi:hypothetical protein